MMNRTNAALAALLLLGFALTVGAREFSVDSLPELGQALASVEPGDSVVLADGVYTASEPLVIEAAGTLDKPIVIAAKTVGGVELAGTAGFRLVEPAAYVVIRGFCFTHDAGELEVAAGVHHCRVTRNIFELNVPSRRRARYLSVVGDDNEIDHNEFRNKSTEGQMLQVHGPGKSAMAQRTWIHHNYFHDFRPSQRNNSSALHIGHSSRSMTSAWTVVEHNLFVRTHGENEGAICNKASDNVYRFNTFGEQSTELSLRHGKRCLVYANFFLGGNGLRIFSHDHRIFSNAFTNCRPAITIGNGGATIPPGPLTSHERPERVYIVHNTLVNNRQNFVMQQRRGGLGAVGVVAANNIIVGGGQAADINGPMEDAVWRGNVLWKSDEGDIPASGYREIDPQLASELPAFYKLPPTSPLRAPIEGFPFVATDVEGQRCGEHLAAGADQPSDERALSPLTASDVGTNASEEKRPLIARSWPATPWIKAPQSPADRP